MITTAEKKEIMAKFGKTPTDSGSSEVQVAILTSRIKRLTEHFAAHKLDHHSKRGLMKLIGRRRRLLRYLQGKDMEAYKNLIKALGLRK